MANKNDITTRVYLDVSDLSKNAQLMKREIADANAEFKEATAGMDDWKKSEEGLSAKLNQLNRTLVVQKTRLSDLQQEYDDLVKAGKGNSAEAQKLSTQIKNQSAVVKKTEKEIGNYTDSLENLGKESKEAEKNTKSLSGGFTVLKGAVASLVADAIKSAVTSFLSLADATREYRTEIAKLNATASQTGVSTKTTEEALKKLNRVTEDSGAGVEALNNLMQAGFNDNNMADAVETLSNAVVAFPDTMSIEGLADSIQESSSVMAKGENATGQYAELLERLGYNLDTVSAEYGKLATEEEKQAYLLSLVDDELGGTAEAYREQNKDLIAAKDAQFEYNDAMADLGAIAEPISSKFKTFAATLISNLIPTLTAVVDGFTNMINGVDGSVDEFGNIMTELATNILDNVSNVITNVVNKVSELLPILIPKLVELLSSIIQKIVEFTPTLLDASLKLFRAVVEAIPPTIVSLLNELPKILKTIADALLNAIPMIFDHAKKLLNTLVEAIPVILDRLVKTLPKVLETIMNFLLKAMPVVLDGAIDLLMQIVKAIPSIITSLIQALPSILSTIVKFLANSIPKMVQAARDMFFGIVQAIPTVISELLKSLPDIISTIVKSLLEGIPELIKVGAQLLGGLIEGMFDPQAIWEGVKGVFNGIVGGFKSLFGIKSPSRVMASVIGEPLAQGIGVGLEDGMDDVEKDLNNSVNQLKSDINSNIAVDDINVNANKTGTTQSGGVVVNNYNTFSGMKTSRYAMHIANQQGIGAWKLATQGGSQ